MTNRQWRLAARPQGRVSESDFEWREEPAADPGAGQIRVRNIHLSLDPTNRIWMNAADSYMPMLPLGDVMRGLAIGVVESSNHPGFQEGDIVQGLAGWQEYYTGEASTFSKLRRIPGVPLSAYFGALGHIGFTAYFGLLDIGQPKEGETLVVSAAGGAVGSLVGQIGKLKGLHVIGIAGTDDKSQWITSELGFDSAINYKKEDVRKRLAALAPNGVDIDFENVGGDILEAVLDHLNLKARVVLCGLISQYNESAPQGPYNFGNLLIKRARLEGFLVMDYVSRFAEAAAQIVPWLIEGKLKYRLDLVDGLQQAPTALNRLFDGANTGKLLVQVSAEPK
jgi:NADPH-dependent curcumin reductase CurA